LKIFIDESGNFLSSDRSAAISCVGALIIPGCKYEKVKKQFLEIIKDWPKAENGEIKGRLLDESHIPQIIPILERADAIYEVTAMDLNHISEEELTNHKLKQAEKITENITDEFHPNYIKEVKNLQQTLREMPNQLYAKTVTMNLLAKKIVEHSTLYYCQRKPAELREFAWCIDAQNPQNISKYEDWWRKMVMPLLQTMSIEKPAPFLVGGNYSYFNKNFSMPEVPEYLKKLIKNEDSRVTDIKAIISKNLEFGVSEKHVGLQLVDIITNAIRRALIGNLKEEGWNTINKIMIFQKMQGIAQNIQLFNLSKNKPASPLEYTKIVRKIGSAGRSMIK